MFAFQFIEYAQIFSPIRFQFNLWAVNTFVLCSMLSFALCSGVVRDLTFGHLRIYFFDGFSFVISAKDLHEFDLSDLNKIISPNYNL